MNKRSNNMNVKPHKSSVGSSIMEEDARTRSSIGGDICEENSAVGCGCDTSCVTPAHSCGCEDLDFNGNRPKPKPAPKPPIITKDYVQDPNYVHTDNNFTDEDKEKLEGIEDGAEVNVQADWNETDVNSDAYIKNKPTDLVTDEELEETVNEIESEISQKSTVSVSPTGTATDEVSYITIDGVEKKIAGLERPIGEGVLTLKKDSDDSGETFSANATDDKTINLNLSKVASTGSYNDLLDKPADIVRNIKGYFVAGITQIEVPFKSSEFGEYPLLRAYNNWQLELIGETSYINYSDGDGNDRKAIIKFYSNGSQVNVKENGFYILG